MMKATLIRHDYDKDGIFGEFYLEDDKEPMMVTLEHAYHQDDGSYAAKTPIGNYRCVFGKHVLHSGPVETFEITGVKGHSGILCCHVGNYNNDSDGCVLCGKEIIIDNGGIKMITDSKRTFQNFRYKLRGVNEFELTIM